MDWLVLMYNLVDHTAIARDPNEGLWAMHEKIRQSGHGPATVRRVLADWPDEHPKWPVWADLLRLLNEEQERRKPRAPLVTYRPARPARPARPPDPSLDEVIEALNNPPADAPLPRSSFGSWRSLHDVIGGRQACIDLGVTMGVIRVAEDGTVERAR